jgi:uncharacterized protein YlxW (UPF0749 family)
MNRQPGGMMDRVRQMYRGGPREEPESLPSSGRADEPSDEVADLRTRLAHLEQLVQGLQDSVHRASLRQDERMSAIEKRLDPVTMAAALSKDARDRGL